MSKFIILIAISTSCCVISCVADASAASPQSPTIGDAGESAPLAQQQGEGADPKETEQAASESAGVADTVPDIPTPEELEQAKAATTAEKGGAKPSPVEPPPASLDSPALKIESAPVDAPQPRSTEPTSSRNPVNAKLASPEETATQGAPVEPANRAAKGIVKSPIVDARRPYLGVVCGSQSATVLRVKERTAASLAGFEVGDVLLKVNGQPVAGFEQFLAVVNQNRPGDTLDVEVQRGEGTTELFVILGAKSVK